MHRNWTFTDLDAKIAAEFGDFLPATLFDSHAHLYRVRDMPEPVGALQSEGPANVTPRIWRSRLGRQLGPERLAGALFMPFPVPGADPALLNRRLLEDLDREPGSRGAVIITPNCRREDVEALLAHPQVIGFKPYHCFAPGSDTSQASLREFVPELAWELAHERGLVIVLHIVRHAAWADPDNQRTLLDWCERFPGARVQMAHAARGFHALNTVRHVRLLASLENVWFDTSGICEAAALVAILRECGHRRLLWGSDFPVSEIRGRCVTVGDGFVWLDGDSVKWDELPALGQPTLVGLESMRALREACETVGLSRAQLRYVFAGNARRLFGL